MKTKTKKPQNRLFKKLNKRLASRLKHDRVNGVNGNNPNDRLELLKTKYEQEIQAKETELMVLKAKLRNLTEFGEEAEKLKEPELALNRYATCGTTEAILDAVDYLWRTGKGTSHGVTASQIRDFVIAHGFPLSANPHNFSIAVNVTLDRLAGGRILETEFMGRNYYKPQRSFGHTAVKLLNRGRSLRSRKISGTGAEADRP